MEMNVVARLPISAGSVRKTLSPLYAQVIASRSFVSVNISQTGRPSQFHRKERSASIAILRVLSRHQPPADRTEKAEG